MQVRAKIVPPFRFGIVEPGVYRGAYPTLKNFPYLKTLGLTTVISLTPEPPTVDLDDFCAINNIFLHHYMGDFPLSTTDSLPKGPPAMALDHPPPPPRLERRTQSAHKLSRKLPSSHMHSKLARLQLKSPRTTWQ